MGIIKAAIGVGALAFVGATIASSPDGALPPAEAARTGSASEIAERFRLVIHGADTGCDVVKGGSVSAHKAQLLFGLGCAGELAEIADARFWTERDDGSVAFTAEDGRIAIRFAAGDGHAFESFGEGAPLVSLVAAGN